MAAAPISRKDAWHQRAKEIYARFPEVQDLDWNAALNRDEELFARVLRDMLKLEQAIPGRSGPRPSLDEDAARGRLERILGRDFTVEPFRAAFKKLVKDDSIRDTAKLTGLNRNVVYRLHNGEMEADGYHMQAIAEAYGKHASYFLEWRVLYICKSMISRLEWNPEATITTYRELDNQRRGTS